MESTRKRTHLSTEQVSLLESSFNENSLPDSAVRSRLAQELSVTERTVQIWFQNRRAKEKKIKIRLEKQSQKPATPNRFQPTFRSLMTPEAFEQPEEQEMVYKRPRSISKPEPKTSSEVRSLDQHQQRALSEGLTQATSLGRSHSDKIPIQIISLQPSILRIGTWTRFSSEQQALEWDLFCYVIFSERAFVWKIRVGKHQFKIQVGFDQIQYIQLQPTGQLDIHVYLPLSFGMLRFQQDQDWVPCGDFTENQQASITPVHSLQGSYESFKNALLDTVAFAPELSTKLIYSTANTPVIVENSLHDIGREYTVSPSATPEPFMMQYNNELTKLRANTAPTTNNHLMLQASFSYSNLPSNNSVQQQQQQQQQVLLQQRQQQLLQQQLLQQQQQQYNIYATAPPTNAFYSSFL
ncbi:hypothetical protein G6F32_001296 [Rhizopus arrhizus]|nr:hypothetical protein G6F32_001296 [Rhizopus arrhizus]